MLSSYKKNTELERATALQLNNLQDTLALTKQLSSSQLKSLSNRFPTMKGLRLRKQSSAGELSALRLGAPGESASETKEQYKRRHEAYIEQWIKEGQFADFADFIDHQINKQITDSMIEKVKTVGDGQSPRSGRI